MELIIIVIVPLILPMIAIFLDYGFWKKRTIKEDDNNRYYPNLNLGKFTTFAGVCLAFLYLIIRLMPYLLKESPGWEDVTLRLGILAFVIAILAIFAKTIRED